MPGAAEVVDVFRALLGAERVDQAIRSGVALQREHARRHAEEGPERADAWLASQRPSGPVFQVTEGGRQVGAIPTRPAARQQRARGAR